MFHFYSSEMTWSDCLEIGLKSSRNGYETYAKYWMETALEKLPNNNTNEATTQGRKRPLQDEYTVKAKLEIMTALLNTEYNLGKLKNWLQGGCSRGCKNETTTQLIFFAIATIMIKIY